MDNPFVIERCYFPQRILSEVLELCKDLISEEWIYIEDKPFLAEAVLQVHNEVEKIIQSIEEIKEPSIENIAKVLKTFNILFIERTEQEKYIEATTIGYTDEQNYKIVIYYKNIKDEIISKSRVHFHDLANRIGVVLAHEMVHLRQYHMIGGNINNAQKTNMFLQRTSSVNLTDDRKKYLSHPREIMAFASMIFQELKSSGLTNKDIRTLFSYEKVGTGSMRLIAQKSTTALEYFQLFKTNEKVMKKLFKDVYGYIVANTNYFKEDIY